MACGDYGGELTDAIMAGAMRDAFTCAYINDVGGMVWPLMTAGVVLLAIGIHSRSAVIPGIIMLLFAPLLITPLPPLAARAFTVALLFILPATFYLLFARMQAGVR